MTPSDTNKKRLTVILVLLLVGGGLLAIGQGIRLMGSNRPAPTATPTPTLPERPIPTSTPTLPERPIPTSTPTPGLVAGPSPTPQQRLIPTPTAGQSTPTADYSLTPSSPPGTLPAPSSTSEATATWPAAPNPSPALTTPLAPASSPGPTQRPATELFATRQRIGVTVPHSDIGRYDIARLGAGWYLQSQSLREPLRPAGMEVVQFVGVHGDSYLPVSAELQDIARRNPGTLWLIGNEPDVIWQSNATPQEYARVYHETYTLLKEVDPTCQVAIGAIAEVTPLRLRYLELVLAAYQAVYGQPMPVDVWNIHLAILREERGAWGVDIPPGLPDEQGILYEIGDNADLEILKQQVRTFRRWMAERGWRDRPLFVTEFGVLMPPDYGFPFDVVKTFMTGAFDFMLNARDSATGCPADGNRLVQRWAWYSVADTVYYTGNLFDPATSLITPLGQVFADYVAQIGPGTGP
jgi:hypothetical protein